MDTNDINYPVDTAAPATRTENQVPDYTVQQLRQKGYRVRVYHNRAAQIAPESQFSNKDVFAPSQFPQILYTEFAPKGGSTVVEITHDEKVFRGEAICSVKDHFCRKTGLNVALIRAIEKARKNGVDL